MGYLEMLHRIEFKLSKQQKEELPDTRGSLLHYVYVVQKHSTKGAFSPALRAGANKTASNKLMWLGLAAEVQNCSLRSSNNSHYT